ncbi:MAG: hypothetical protein F6K39_21625 [Okeania sp. SIO3B3]|nr:hypothetical protein [Okeania sp. SIO3B3]
MSETCQKWEPELVEFNAEVDHVHLLLSFNSKAQLSKYYSQSQNLFQSVNQERFYRQPVL